MWLDFGVPYLDELLEIPRGAPPYPTTTTESLTLLGPDGSGKSVLALHLASRYRARCEEIFRTLPSGGNLPLILYLSSDLQFDGANAVWEHFGLDKPGGRQVPFERISGRRGEIRRRMNSRSVRLQLLEPNGVGARSEVGFLLNLEAGSDLETTVGFLDLTHSTSGDDWSFINSLIANLEAVPRSQVTLTGKDRAEELGHLVIIDSVAGFETFVGKLDAYGMEQSRRARIAQCMRNAGSHTHLVFVVEEPDDGKRLPEEYVTDVVVRLRTRREGGRSLRTVEIEKARARDHAVGEHVFEIRSHLGSSTGDWENPDTPVLNNEYIHVFQSLSHRDLLMAGDVGEGKFEPKDGEERAVAPFGLHYLDRLLESGRAVGGATAKPSGEELSDWGLRAGSCAAIIGDSSTGKTVLAEKFIAEGFRGLVESVLAISWVLRNPELARGLNKQDPILKRFDHVNWLLSQCILDDPSHENPDEPCREPFSLMARSWSQGESLSREALETRFKDDFIQEELSIKTRRDVIRQRVRREKPDSAPKTRWNRYADLKKFQACMDSLVSPEQRKQALIELFRHPNLRAPGILLTTSDRKVPVLAERCLGYLRGRIDPELVKYFDAPMSEEGWQTLREILEEQIIVRRFDIDSMTAAALFDAIQRNVIEAQYLLRGPYFPPRQADRYPKSNRIRLVIDDVRVLSNLCPSVSAESAFLPFLVFYLEREGVTSLFVHTDGIRPGVRPEDPISLELMSLLKQVILTWSVPFQGQNRVAITVIPASSRDTNGIVREVEFDQQKEFEFLKSKRRRDLPEIDVTPNFELYADLEIGKPRLVPLAVFLFNATKACRQYMDQEDILFREQFAAISAVRNGESGRILWPVEANQYYALRDLTHLPWDVHADYTIVDQVDGFWSLDAKGGALAAQKEYLMSEDPGAHDDPFGLFRGKPLSLKPQDDDKGPRFQRRFFFQNSGYRARIVDFIPNPEIPGMPDRVPFMWDFSFILVPAGPWTLAGQGSPERIDCGELERLRTKAEESEPSKKSPEEEVGEVLRDLQLKKHMRKVVPWRKFLGACKTVADRTRQERGTHPVAFDFASTSAETFSSLFLEIWFSEIMEDVTRYRDYSSQIKNWSEWLHRLSTGIYTPLTHDASEPFSLARLLREGLQDRDSKMAGRSTLTSAFKDFPATYQRAAGVTGEIKPRKIKVRDRNKLQSFDADESTKTERQKLLSDLPLAALCLYKTWLLLLDVFDFEAVLDPESAFEIKQPKRPSRQSMAVRHYYRTACDEQARLNEENAVAESQYALAMPGHFSTRGDSFLASPKASRSKLLASHAIDLLSSRRANLTRMQMGIGLPVRDVLDNEGCDMMRTALRVITTDPSSVQRAKGLMGISYEDLRGLGGGTEQEIHGDTDKEMGGKEQELRWLFRNGIPEYDRVSRALQKWLARLARWTVSYRARHPVDWHGGFIGYDALSEERFASLVDWESFTYFGELCDYLVAEIEAAERQTGQSAG